MFVFNSHKNVPLTQIGDSNKNLFAPILFTIGPVDNL